MLNSRQSQKSNWVPCGRKAEVLPTVPAKNDVKQLQKYPFFSLRQ